MSPPGRETRSSALALYYLLQFSSVGITLPFFPQYLKSLGLTGTQVGVLLAIGPALSLFAPPIWGQIADRSGKPGLALLVVTGGACVCFALFLRVEHFYDAFAALAIY